MLEEIENFINRVFTNEYIDNIRKAISLMEAFEYQKAYDKIMDAINDESVSDIDGRAEHFTVALTDALDFIVKQHLISLTDEATFADRLLILDALYRVQHLEDYTAVQSILLSEEDSIDQLSMILEELTNKDQGYFLTILKDVNDSCIALLNEYVEHKSKPKTVDTINPAIINRLKLFNSTLGHENLATEMIAAGMWPGYSLRLYIPFVKDIISELEETEETAISVLSIIYMSDTPETDIVTAYRAMSDAIFKDLTRVSKIESTILSLLAKLSDARKIEHEKAGLS